MKILVPDYKWIVKSDNGKHDRTITRYRTAIESPLDMNVLDFSRLRQDEDFGIPFVPPAGTVDKVYNILAEEAFLNDWLEYFDSENIKWELCFDLTERTFKTYLMAEIHPRRISDEELEAIFKLWDNGMDLETLENDMRELIEFKEAVETGTLENNTAFAIINLELNRTEKIALYQTIIINLLNAPSSVICYK